MKILAYAAVAAGGAGLASRVMLYQADQSQGATPSSTSTMLAKIDPAAIIGKPYEGQLLDVGTALDAALFLWGAWYLWMR